MADLSRKAIKVPANSGFYGLPENREVTKYNNEFANADTKNNLKNLYIGANSFIITNPDDLAEYGFERVCLLSFKERKYHKEKNPRLVYKVEREMSGGEKIYYLKTGLYIGYLYVAANNSDKFRLEINTGYNENLLEKNRHEGKDPLKFCSLVYPAVTDPKNEGEEKGQTDAPLYGLPDAETRFSVGYLRIGEDFGFEDIIESENEFLNRIENLLNGHDENPNRPD